MDCTIDSLNWQEKFQLINFLAGGPPSITLRMESVNSWVLQTTILYYNELKECKCMLHSFGNTPEDCTEVIWQYISDEIKKNGHFKCTLQPYSGIKEVYWDTDNKEFIISDPVPPEEIIVNEITAETIEENVNENIST